MTKTILRNLILRVGNTLLLYIPVILFWRFVLWNGEPNGERFVSAFKIFSVVAFIHLLVIVYFKRPVDRFALATDIWLIFCGLLCWLTLWDVLRYFGDNLRVTGYWIVVFLVGVVATYKLKGGLIAAGTASPKSVRKYSLKILLLISIILFISYEFRTETLWVGVLPTILLSVLSEKYCNDAAEKNIVI